jgi:LPXTG-motif cell wall-anchored protein
MSRIYQMIKASTGSSTSSFILAGVLLLVGAAITVTLKRAENQSAEKSGSLKQAA